MKNFYSIGCVFERVMSINYSRYDCDKILVISDCLFTMNCKMLFEIEDTHYKIFISEDRNVPFTCPTEKDEKESFPTSSDTIESSAATCHEKQQDDSLQLHDCNGLDDITLSSLNKSPPPSHNNQDEPVTFSELPIINPMINVAPIPKECFSNSPQKPPITSPKDFGGSPTSLPLIPIPLEQPRAFNPSNIQQSASPSPIPTQTSNKFGPLLRPNASISSSDSSLLEPLFP